MKKLNLLFLLVSICFVIHAQTENAFKQTIRGVVLDEDTKAPLVGVNIILEGITPVKGAVTDINGSFKITDVPVGRQTLKVSIIGYKKRVLSNLLVGSGKELVLKIELRAKIENIETITVKSSMHSNDEPLNEMALVSARSFSVEQTKKYAGGIGDPARMAKAYAGVSKDAGQDNNAIIIRGNTPNGLLWHVEGVEVPNPNHFSSDGAASGAITLFSHNLLAKSDFYTGAFPAQYGNALSGAFDINLRPGNNELPEYAFQAGILGVEAAMEGPFKEGGQSSYLINYRYSTLSMFNKIGIEIVSKEDATSYQDVAFKLNFPTRNAGTFSLFGLGGVSDNDYDLVSLNYMERINTDMGVIGLSNFLRLSEKSFLKSTVSLSGTRIKTDEDELFDGNNFSYFENKTNWFARFATKFRTKLDVRNTLETGITYSRMGYDYFEREVDGEELPPYNDYELVNSKGESGSLQAFVNWKFKLDDKLTFVNGVHVLQFGLNDRVVVEPRLALKWQMSSKESLSLAFGKHSQIGSLSNYLGKYEDENGNAYYPNVNLDFTKSNHYILGYNRRLGNSWMFQSEAYYQKLYDIPVCDAPNSIFSTILVDEDYLEEHLVNEGSGENYGIDLTLHRLFDDDYYIIFTSSLFQSTYKTLDGVKRKTPYASNFGFDFYVGKEFAVGKQKHNYFDINIGGSWGGNLRFVPIDLEESRLENTEVFDESRAYEKRLPDLWSIDLDISYYLNGENVSHEFRFDLLNATNKKNIVYQFYNYDTQQVDNETETGIIPALTYRIEF